MKNRKRAILISCAVILVCMSVIMGGTYALFTSTKTVKNHLQAGTLDVMMKRVNLEYRTLTQSGYLETVTNTDVVTFPNTSEENIFGLTGDHKIIPGSYFDATMQIFRGDNSNVAFDYSVSIVITDQTTQELADQLAVTVWDVNNTKTEYKLSDFVGGKQINIGAIDNNTASPHQFRVRIDFPDRADNNEAQTDTVNFDLVVYAVQLSK